MPKYNTTFELSVDDLDLIEDALRVAKQAKADAKAAKTRKIHDLLGRLHNQKTFFRPAKGTYVSG
ncbi:hypothetical protein [uncultured Tateyamaria sp.]|uniref:hypothetical protein n=1 Tax=uncultured Tateyamaria sp. TaxID=455651 RepID=UPI002628EB5F|nr:hypothetical protein [uncultured Tateyamaria sp.]